MKRWKYLVLGLALGLGVIVLVVYLSINGVVRRAVERHSTQSLNLATSVGGANVSLFGGEVSLDHVQIASPGGFGSPFILKLDGGDVAVKYSDLRGDPVRVASLTLHQPRLLIEQSGGKFNVQALVDQVQKSRTDAGNPGDGSRQEGEPVRMIIDKLRIEEAVVVLRPGLPGLEKEIEVKVPTLEMSNVGSGEGNQNGAAIKDVVVRVVMALAEQSGKADIPGQLKAALEANVGEMTTRLKGEAEKKVREITQGLDDKLNGSGLEVDKAVKGQMDKLLGEERKRAK